jgi:hypothetical protein
MTPKKQRVHKVIVYVIQGKVETEIGEGVLYPENRLFLNNGVFVQLKNTQYTAIRVKFKDCPNGDCAKTFSSSKLMGRLKNRYYQLS